MLAVCTTTLWCTGGSFSKNTNTEPRQSHKNTCEHLLTLGTYAAQDSSNLDASHLHPHYHKNTASDQLTSEWTQPIPYSRVRHDHRVHSIVISRQKNVHDHESYISTEKHTIHNICSLFSIEVFNVFMPQSYFWIKFTHNKQQNPERIIQIFFKKQSETISTRIATSNIIRRNLYLSRTPRLPKQYLHACVINNWGAHWIKINLESH